MTRSIEDPSTQLHRLTIRPDAPKSICWSGSATNRNSRGFTQVLGTVSIGCPKINLLVRVGNEQELSRFYAGLGYRLDEVVCYGKRLEVDEP